MFALLGKPGYESEKEKLEKELEITLPHLSMGMSADFPVAIEEGATIIRVGTDIFGSRHPH